MIDAVRKRPQMYIGDTAHAHHMLWEVIANCLDQNLVGRCYRVEVRLEDDGSAIVRDDGPGISLEMVEKIFTTLHPGPTADGHHPHAHANLNGVGVAVVSALSESLEVEVRRDGKRCAQRFARGVALGPPEVSTLEGKSGTRVRFRPDGEIFRDRFDYQTVKARLFELSALGRGLSFELRQGSRTDFLRCESLADLLPPAPGIHVRATDMEVVARWVDSDEEVIDSFVNMTRTRNGGSHVQGMMKGLADSLRRLVPGARSDDLRYGLRAVVHVIIRDPKLVGPPRDKLLAPEIVEPLRKLVGAEPFPVEALRTCRVRLRPPPPG